MRHAYALKPKVASVRARHSLSDIDLANALGQLSILLAGGVVLLDAVREVVSLEPRSRVRHAWADVYGHLDSGTRLSRSIEQAGLTRRSDIVAVLRASETDGSLAGACAALEAGLRVHVEHRRCIRAALIYPMVAGISLVMACVFLLWRVVPAMADIGGGDATLSWHALPLVWMSEHLQSLTLWSLVVPLIIVGFVGFLSVRKNTQLRYTSVSDRLFQLASYVDVVRRLRLHGEPLVESMMAAEACLRSHRLQLQLGFAREQVVAGRRLACALDEADLLPGLVGRLVAVGETTGTLNASLAHVVRVLRQEARHRLERMQLIAPMAVLACVGGLLVWIVVSVVLPVYTIALNEVVAL